MGIGHIRFAIRPFNDSYGKGELPMQKITIRGIRFDNVDMDGALLLAKDALESEGVTAVVTPNAEIAQMCLEDAALSEIINAAEIILPDGAGVVMGVGNFGNTAVRKGGGRRIRRKRPLHGRRYGKVRFFLAASPVSPIPPQKSSAPNFPLCKSPEQTTATLKNPARITTPSSIKSMPLMRKSSLSVSARRSKRNGSMKTR